MMHATTVRSAAEVVLGRQRSPQHDSGPHMVPYLRAANVKDGVLELGDVKEMNFTPTEREVFSLRAGDVLVTEGSGSLKAVGASAVWRAELGGVVCFQNTLLRMRPREGVTDGRFLEWWARSAFGSGIFASIATGANIYHISAERVRALPMELPALEEQRRIADFLDAETARIDEVSRLRSRQKDLLFSRRWSFFQGMLDATAAPVIPLRRVIRSIIDGPFGSAFSSSDYVGEGAAVVRLGNIGFGEYRTSGQARIPVNLYERFKYHEVRRGDLLVAGLGDARNHAGRACVAPDLGLAIVKGKCFRARLESEFADAEFIALLLSSPVGASAIEGRGSTRSMINLEIVKSALLPIPALEKQRHVAKLFQQSWQSTRAAIRACDRQLQLFTERRQALITAAVTGQFDVSTASGRNVTDGVTV